MDSLLTLLLLGAAVAAAFWFAQRSRTQRQAVQAERLAAVRAVAEEDVTQLGERLAAQPSAELSTEATEDYQSGLDAYEKAKRALTAAQRPEDLQWVSRALDDGRFALDRVAARRDGRPLPERLPPCFFDQRHGSSVTQAAWAPSSGQPRDVAVCAACAARLADGAEPEARTVATPNGQRPYWEAGPAYAPWAYGWYGGAGSWMLTGMLAGTMLGGFGGGGYGSGYESGYDAGFADGGDAGGDAGGGDFGGGDFGGGGGFGGGGDFGGF
jgi:hypothetical protein